MGKSHAEPTDANLRLRGVENIRVADLSICPRMVNSHPSATAVMIGERAADLLLKAHYVSLAGASDSSISNSARLSGAIEPILLPDKSI